MGNRSSAYAGRRVVTPRLAALLVALLCGSFASCDAPSSAPPTTPAAVRSETLAEGGILTTWTDEVAAGHGARDVDIPLEALLGKLPDLDQTVMLEYRGGRVAPIPFKRSGDRWRARMQPDARYYLLPPPPLDVRDRPDLPEIPFGFCVHCEATLLDGDRVHVRCLNRCGGSRPPQGEGEPSVDVAVTKTVEPQLATVGDELVFVITVGNSGPDAATDVVVSDVLPIRSAYVSDDGGGAYDAAAGEWSVGMLPPGGVATLRITALALAAGCSANTARVVGVRASDTNRANDETVAFFCAAEACPPRADPFVTKSASLPETAAGQTVRFTVTAGNNGPDPATEVVLQDLLPDGVAYASHSGPGVYDPLAGTWRPGTIPAGAVALLAIDAVAEKAGCYTNRAAVVAAHEADVRLDNNEAQAGFCVTSQEEPPGAADLSVTKTGPPGPVTATTPVSYEVRVANAGPAAASSVTLRDTLPSGASLASLSTSQGACADQDGTVTCDLQTIPAGGAAVVTVVLNLADEAGVATNIATATASTADPDLSNNSATSKIAVSAAPPPSGTADLNLLFHALPGPFVQAGREITLRTVVSNSGPDQATGVRAKITLAPGWTFNGLEGGGDYALAAGQWNIGSLPRHAITSLYLRVTAAGPGTILTSTAEVFSAEQADPDSTPNNGAPGEDDLETTAVPCEANGIWLGSINPNLGGDPDELASLRERHGRNDVNLMQEILSINTARFNAMTPPSYQFIVFDPRVQNTGFNERYGFIVRDSVPLVGGGGVASVLPYPDTNNDFVEPPIAIAAQINGRQVCIVTFHARFSGAGEAAETAHMADVYDFYRQTFDQVIIGADWNLDAANVSFQGLRNRGASRIEPNLPSTLLAGGDLRTAADHFVWDPAAMNVRGAQRDDAFEREGVLVNWAWWIDEAIINHAGISCFITE